MNTATNFLIMVAALGLIPRLFGFLRGRDTIRIRPYVPLSQRMAGWGCVEWALIGIAVLVVATMYLLGLL